MSTTIVNKNASFAQKYGNAITIGLWVIALSSHAILLPKFFHDIAEKKK